MNGSVFSIVELVILQTSYERSQDTDVKQHISGLGSTSLTCKCVNSDI